MKLSSIVCFIALALAGSLARAQDDVEITPDLVYGHKFGMALTMDEFRPQDKEKANGAAVLFMVSGGWVSSWSPPEGMAARFKPLTDKGFTVFAVRHGSSPKFTIPEVVADVRRAVRYVRLNAEKFGIDADRIGVNGGSAGGHLSLMLGTTADTGDEKSKDPIERVSDRVAAVVAYYPPTDLRPWVTDPESSYYKNFPALRFEADKADDYSPLFQVSDDDAPTLLVHGDKDLLVPLDHSEKIMKELEAKNVPAKLVVIEGAAHGFPGEQGVRATNELVAWFEKYLAKPAE